MHRSSILFTKWQLNTLVLLGTSSEITTFLEIAISKIALICTESADARSASTRNVCTGGACIGGFCTRGNFARGACIMAVSIGKTRVGGSCAEGVCVDVRNLMS